MQPTIHEVQEPPKQFPPQPRPEVIVYGHSPLLYWWPAWFASLLMAMLTWLQPTTVQLGHDQAHFFPGNGAGVIFTLVLLGVILLTNMHVRGVVSISVVLAIAFTVLLLAYLGYWDSILRWFGNMTVYMDSGFYAFFGIGLFVCWLFTVLVMNRLSFWRVRPGQITHEFILGATDRSYDTDNMIFMKQQNDLFRHWFLGLGSGDLSIQTMGGMGEKARIENVLFIGSKLTRIQNLIATKPDVAEKP